MILGAENGNEYGHRRRSRLPAPNVPIFEGEACNEKASITVYVADNSCIFSSRYTSARVCLFAGNVCGKIPYNESESLLLSLSLPSCLSLTNSEIMFMDNKQLSSSQLHIFSI